MRNFSNIVYCRMFVHYQIEYEQFSLNLISLKIFCAFSYANLQEMLTGQYYVNLSGLTAQV